MQPLYARFAVAAAITSTTLAACNKSVPAPEAPTATPVTVISVSHDSVVQPVVATGTYGPRDEIPLSFKIAGVVARVMVDEGATVRRGQVLATLDLREIDALVAKARVGVDKSARDQARLERLFADSVATLAQMQDATSVTDAARADLASALVNREYATIVAPGNGVILQRQMTAGSTTGPGATVLTLGSNERGRVLRVGLADRDALRMKQGDKAVAQFDAVPGKLFTGRVMLLGRAADAQTGTYTAEISLDDADALPAGLVGRVTLSPQAAAVATLVPIDALVEANEDSAVIYTASSDKTPIAERHVVRILFLSGDRVAVRTDANGESLRRVITRGAQYLAEGMPVRIVNDVGNTKTVGTEPTKAVSANTVRP